MYFIGKCIRSLGQDDMLRIITVAFVYFLLELYPFDYFLDLTLTSTTGILLSKIV